MFFNLKIFIFGVWFEDDEIIFKWTAHTKNCF